MRARILAVIILGALGATACGSSSKSATPSVTTAPAGSDATSGTTVPTTTALRSHDGGDSGGDFCDLLKNEADAFDAENLLSSKSAGEIKDVYANVEARLDDTVSKAPDSIKSDLATVNDSIKLLVDALKKADYDFTKLTPESFKGLDDPKFETASANIDKYLTQTCHITPTT